MNRWQEISGEYASWLRSFPMLASIGRQSRLVEVVPASDVPVFLDVDFWGQRTHDLEELALEQISDQAIDCIFHDVSQVIDEDLLRFNPLIAYYGRFAPDGDPDRIEWERDAAHCVKRDLAWIAVEKSIGVSGFFSSLVYWYDQGRWPFGWAGEYPDGYVRVI